MIPKAWTMKMMMMSCDRLIIAPVIAGSGGGAGRILLGAALIGMMFIPGIGAFSTVAAGQGILGGTMAFTTMGSLMFSLGGQSDSWRHFAVYLLLKLKRQAVTATRKKALCLTEQQS